VVRLNDGLGKNGHRGYDPFEGLSAKFVRPLSFENKSLGIALPQTVRRFPLNLRPGWEFTRFHFAGFSPRSPN
jgi:hypothetical protein